MKKKQFTIPEAIIVAFNNEDVIATSGPGNPYVPGEGGDEGYDPDNN